MKKISTLKPGDLLIEIDDKSPYIIFVISVTEKQNNRNIHTLNKNIYTLFVGTGQKPGICWVDYPHLRECYRKVK